ARRGAGRVSDRALTDPRPRPERPAGGRRPLHVSRDDGVGRARRRSGRRHGGAPLARRAGGAPVALVLGVLTWRQSTTWRDARTMWARVVAVAPDNAYGHKSLGDVARDAGDL